VFSFLTVAFLVLSVVVGLYLADVTKDLPDYRLLKDYHPPVTTRVEAADGTLLAEYARENRLFQPIGTMPPLLIDAFVSAEDKDFFQHHGVDFDGITRAIRDNAMHYLAGDRGPLVGASTITQQVAKNFFLTPDQSLERKVREAILALRIDASFSKDKILELYLNQIFMGSINGKVYGVASAALNYFHKALYQLDLSEMAFLAGLPKGPNNYNPFRYPAAGTTCSIAWSRTATSPLPSAQRPRPNRSTRRRVRPVCGSTRLNISPRRCAASWRRPMATTSSMAAGFRCGRRSIRHCRKRRARR
jgi:penicillin-binding protein 1A